MRALRIVFAAAVSLIVCLPALAAPAPQGEAMTWSLFEDAVTTTKAYAEPFVDVEVDAVFTMGERQWRVPAFWDGGGTWKVRFAPPQPGEYRYTFVASDADNRDFAAPARTLRVRPYAGDNPLLRHGFLRVAADARHFEHADGTPFLWLGDTQWKCLSRRLPFAEFQELAADRRAKGFSVVQIVCGPYPDEGPWEERWENEGGKPYLTRDFRAVNPEYFRFADRRLMHLVEQGLVPAIVGGWGRGDCDGMALAGLPGIKRHWRNLVARYGALPTVWIVGGESEGPAWTEVAELVKRLDAHARPRTMHPHASGRSAVTDEAAIDFDMLQTGHGGFAAAVAAIPKVEAALARQPAMPVLIGEFCYEGHMQLAYDDAQRHGFWASMLRGAAGLTYGAAGVWHASVPGDPGLNRVYDLTTWREGCGLPGSRQLGLGKQLLASLPWARFQPRPDWAEDGVFAAGIPGEARVHYQPRRGLYDWRGIVVRGLEPGVVYRASYFDPIRGGRHELGRWLRPDDAMAPIQPHAAPIARGDTASWRDEGTPTARRDGIVRGGKGMLTTLAGVDGADFTASVRARSDAEVGLVLRMVDADHYLVGLYSPLLRALYLHERRGGDYGPHLGRVEIPQVGPDVVLTVAATGDRVAAMLSDGATTWRTPAVRVAHAAPGRVGLWLHQVGDAQEYADFTLSRTPLSLPAGASAVAADVREVWGADCRMPDVPCPQDWVLVLERAVQ